MIIVRRLCDVNLLRDRDRLIAAMETDIFSAAGYAGVPAVLSHADCDAAIRHVEALALTQAGSRNLLALPWCAQLVALLKSNSVVSAQLPLKAVAVQCTLFEKTATRNWGVAIHQDLSIPVRERVTVPGCTGWSRKEGVHYTQPPAAVLAELVALRLHLDPCPPQAGPLRVVPGSHRDGRLSDAEIERLRTQNGEVECTAGRGDALLMRPLLLHTSSRVTGNDARRVLHFLFGPPALPYGLSWQDSV